MCCSVLQCAAVCGSVRHLAAVHCRENNNYIDEDVRCSVLQDVAGCCRVLQGVAGCCRVLQGVAGCCGVL